MSFHLQWESLQSGQPLAVEDVQGDALLDTGASRSVGGYMMVQYVIDYLSQNTAPPWLESADPAVSFTFAGGEKAH